MSLLVATVPLENPPSPDQAAQLDQLMNELEPILTPYMIRTERVRQKTMVSHSFSSRLHYVVAKVQTRPGIGEMFEDAVWVVLRQSGDLFYVPTSFEEVQALIHSLDPNELGEKSPNSFVRAFYKNTDWWRKTASEPESYEKLRKSSAMSDFPDNSFSKKFEGRERESLTKTIASDGSQIFSIGKSTLRRSQDGVWLVSLKGPRNQSSYEHGRLIREIKADTALPYFSDRLHHAIEQSPLSRTFPFLKPIMNAYVEIFHFAPMRNNTPEDFRKLVESFSAGAQYSYKKALNALVLPDVAQYALAKTSLGLSNLIGAFGSLPTLGCTTFRAESDYGSVMARNLDYEGGGLFDRQAAIYFVDTEEKNDLRYLSFTTLGMPLGVITGVNEKGIFVSLHQLTVDDVRNYGTPILLTLERIMRRAHNLSDAIEILRKTKHVATWRVILHSAEERQTKMVDLGARSFTVSNFSEWKNIATNTAEAEVMKKKAYSKSYLFVADSLLRTKTLEHQMEQNGPHFTLEKIVDMLSSTLTWSEEFQKLIPSTSVGSVGRMNNVQSLIVVPDAKAFYIAKPPKNFANSIHGTYRLYPLDFDQLSEGHWTTNDEHSSMLQNSLPSELRNSVTADEDLVLARAMYRKAAMLITVYGQYEEAIRLMEMAEELRPNDFIYPFMAGMARFQYSWMAGKIRGDLLEEAFENFNRADTKNPSKYHRQIIRLFQARYLSLKGRHGEAMDKIADMDPEEYNKELTTAILELKLLAYNVTSLRRLTVDYFDMDVERF